MLATTAFLSTIGATAQTQKPNIIFIMCDDMGYGDLGCYGQKLISTPQLDKMAAEGMRFTQAYSASPVSAPSRNCLMTGQHGGHVAIRGNKEFWKGSIQYGVNTDHEFIGQACYDTAHVILPEIMKDNGYATGMFGKWAAGPDYDAPPFYRYLPEQHGIDEYYGYLCQFQAHLYYPNFINRYSQKAGDKQTIRIELTDNTKYPMFGPQYAKRTQYSADLVHEKAMEWLRDRSADPDRPFFGIFTYTLPHAELFQPRDSIFHLYEQRFAQDKVYRGSENSRYNPTDHAHADFAAMVTRLDTYVGQILEYLRSTGLDRSTLVIFTSDNGPHEEGGADPKFFNRDGLLRGIKRSVYEGGMREPFIAWWPGHVPAGVTNPHITAFYDMMPTFCELAGIDDYEQRYRNTAAEGKSTLYFDNYHDYFDGISIAPTLLGDNRHQKQHEFIFWEMTESNVIAVRRGDWKLVCNSGQTELYNLANDLHEDHNVKDRFPQIHDQLVDIVLREHVDNRYFVPTLPQKIAR